MPGVLRAIILATHVLAAAAWFGGMAYSFAVLHPRARAFFGSLRQFEEFVAFIAAGARWKVLAGCAVIALTGVMLLPGHDHAPAVWRECLAAKVVLFVIAVAIFCYTSWRLWPARVFAAPAEIPAFQRRFRWIALSLMGIVGLCFLLASVAAHGNAHEGTNTVRKR
jgi:uncharacterized membrane protein